MKQWMVYGLIVVVLTLAGGTSLASAALQNSSVSECLENPEQCAGNEPERQPGTQPDAEQASSVGIDVFDVLRMIAALVFVVALLYALLKFLSKKSRSFQETQLVQHLGGTSLGANRSVQVVKIGERVLVLGIGEDVSLLTEIDDEAERAKLIAANEQIAEMDTDWMHALSKWKNRKTEPESEAKAATFQQELEQKMNAIRKERGQMLDQLKENQKDE